MWSLKDVQGRLEQASKEAGEEREQRRVLWLKDTECTRELNELRLVVVNHIIALLLRDGCVRVTSTISRRWNW